MVIYSRFQSIRQEECNSLEEAKRYLREMEDEGDGYALGIYDGNTRTMFVTDNMGELEEEDIDIYIKRMEDFKKMGLDISIVAFY